MSFFELFFADGKTERRDAVVSKGSMTLKKSDVPNGVDHIDAILDSFAAKAGDPGYFLVPSVNSDHSSHSGLTFFKPRPDGEFVFAESAMPVYGVAKDAKATLAIVSGMSHEYSLVVDIKDGCYRIFPRFRLYGEKPYENMEIKFFALEGADANYAGMARCYRKYQLGRGACSTLKERAAKNPVLREMAAGLEVRLRLAWKPVPSTIDEQTEANEPTVHVALTFRQAGEIIDEFHRQGFKHVEFCLVGWNCGGHDGRFPDILPVEPGCGTEDDLNHLIAKAKSYGYLIVGHTNVFEGYSIGKRFKKANVLIQRDGSMKRGGNWGGGKSYLFCPKKAYEDYFSADAKTLKELGFRGAHYLDVLSILSPFECCDPKHKLNRHQAAVWRSKILALARKSCGASASEGAWDFCAKDLDYVLYAAFFLNEPKDKQQSIIDRYAPFWFIAYHGIQLYNCFTDTVNAASKSDKTLPLRNYAWGGRPLVYFYSKFISGMNPWGEEDIRYDSPEGLRKTIEAIKPDYHRYRKLAHLQYEFMEDFEEMPDGVYKTCFSDGSVMLCNLKTGEIKLEKKI